MKDFDHDSEFADIENGLISIPMHRHDYGDGCFSFDYDFLTDELLKLPLVEGFYFEEYVTPSNRHKLRYCDKNGVLKLHPFNNVAHFIKEYGEHLIGTAEHPYQFWDCGEQFMIVDRGDYVCVLDFYDIASSFAEGFRVKKDEYYKAYNEFLLKNGIDPVEC